MMSPSWGTRGGERGGSMRSVSPTPSPLRAESRSGSASPQRSFHHSSISPQAPSHQRFLPHDHLPTRPLSARISVLPHPPTSTRSSRLEGRRAFSEGPGRGGSVSPHRHSLEDLREAGWPVRIISLCTLNMLMDPPHPTPYTHTHTFGHALSIIFAPPHRHSRMHSTFILTHHHVVSSFT